MECGSGGLPFRKDWETRSQYQSVSPIKAREQGWLITGMREAPLSHPLVTSLSPPRTEKRGLCFPGFPVALCGRPCQVYSSELENTDSTSF